MPIRILDVRGLACPLPVLRAKKALRDVAVGEVLRILATDPGSLKDMPVFCRQTGHELVATGTEPPDVLVFEIRRCV